MYCNNNDSYDFEATLYFTLNTFNISLLKSKLSQKFEVKQNKIRMFNFYGLEVCDDSDLHCFEGKYNFENTLFLVDQNVNFDSRFILKMFEIKKKLGQVIFIII